MPNILSEVAESIGTITLDHERRRNALSRGLVEEIVATPALLQQGEGAGGDPAR
jgi:enoyl-CoA hydratase/carnithine racemase